MIYFLDNSLQLQKIVTSKNVISAIHEHELNGLIRADVELDLSYANKFLILGIDHVGYYYKDEFYLHKIQRVEYDHVNETATVVLRHIFFEDMIFGKLIRDVRPQNQDALTVSQQTIDANTRWQTIMTDVTGRLSTNFYWQVPYEVIEFMTENYRIEYLPKILFDGQNINGFQLHLANKIGEDKNIRIPYGSRVLDLKYEEDYSEIITKLVVHGKGEEVGDGYGRRINISDVNFSRNGVESPVGSLYLEDESITNTYGNDGQTPREGREVFEDIEDANELAEAGYQHYLQVSRPQMLFTADVADIGDVGIGDSVMIIRREYDVYFNARIHKLSVDLLYPEDAQVELGDYKHFKESKIARKTREKNNRVQGQLSDRITRLKREANDRFDNEVAQWQSEYEQALIDVHAEIEADRVDMTNLIEDTRTEFTDNLNAEVAQTKEYAEQQAQEKADSVQTNLDSFKDSHQQLYDEVTGNILDIDTFLGDKSKTLEQQFDKVRTDFGTLQTDLDGVESDLTATKTDLQNQLDEARAELDGLEVGGRNLIIKSGITNGALINASGNIGSSNTHKVTDFTPINANTEYIFSAEQTPETESNYENLRIGFYDSDRNFLFVTFIREPDKKGVVFTAPRNAHFTRISVGNYPINLMLTRGNVPMDWTPAPEDTEEKITTLNQQIEFIDGQLSAKLEQTDIEPINNKITEYGNSLTANAQSIQSLLDKTELHDGDITQWSNETKANAESISQTLTRVEETETGISQAQTDIQTNADGIAGVISDVETIDGNLTTLTTDFNVEAGKVETLISKTDGHDTQLTNIVADYNSIEQTVARMDGDMITGFSNVDQRFDSITSTVANIKLNTRNMLQGSDFEDMSLIRLFGDSYLRAVGASDYAGHIRMGPADGLNTTSFQFRNLVNFEAGEDYYFVLEYRTLAVRELDYLQLEREDGSYITIFDADTGNEGLTNLEFGSLDWHKKTIRINFSNDESGMLRIGTRFDQGNTTRGWIDIYQPYLTNTMNREWVPHPRDGQNIDEFVNRVSEVEQTAEQIRSTVYDSTGLATIIAQSSSAIDIISENLNLTGNLNVKGQIESISMSAVEADFGRLFASQLTSNVIKSTHIEASTSLVNKLFASSARIDELITKTHFVNEMHALTLNVVDLNASEIRARLLTANTIEAEWLKGGTALIDRLFSSTAMFERMMAKSGFVTTLNTVTIDTDQLTVRRPDGVAWIRNGMARGHVPVQTFDFYGDEVSFSGLDFYTNSSSWQRFRVFDTPHEGTRLRIVWAVGFTGQAASEYVEVRVRTYGNYKPINMGTGTSYRRQFVRSGETVFITQDVPMPPPNYQHTQAYLEFRRDPDGSGSSNRVRARVNFIGQYD